MQLVCFDERVERGSDLGAGARPRAVVILATDNRAPDGALGAAGPKHPQTREMTPPPGVETQELPVNTKLLLDWLIDEELRQWLRVG